MAFLAHLLGLSQKNHHGKVCRRNFPMEHEETYPVSDQRSISPGQVWKFQEPNRLKGKAH